MNKSGFMLPFHMLVYFILCIFIMNATIMYERDLFYFAEAESMLQIKSITNLAIDSIIRELKEFNEIEHSGVYTFEHGNVHYTISNLTKEIKVDLYALSELAQNRLSIYINSDTFEIVKWVE